MRTLLVFTPAPFVLLLTVACSSDNGSSGNGATGYDGGPSSPDATAGQVADSGTSLDAYLVPKEAAAPLDAGSDARGPSPDGGGGHSDAATADAGGSKDATADADAASPSDAGGGDADASGDGTPADDGGPSEASADAAALPPLLGAWSFDEDGGTSSADLSGQGHAAMLLGGASFGAGKSGGGLVLDGVSAYADVGVTLVDTTKSFTVLAWASFTVTNQWEVAVSEDDVSGSLFGLKLRGDGSNAFDFDSETSDVMSPGFVVAQSTSTAQAATWVHLAGVYDAGGGGSLTLYVDGSRQASAVVGQALLPATGHLLLGRGLYNGATGSFLHGTLDDVAVYGGALSDVQVAAAYAVHE